MIKKLIPVTLFILAGLAAITSCSKSGTTPANSLNATVNGATYKANAVQGAWAPVGTGFDVEAYFDSSHISFYMNSFDTTTPRTYTLVDPATNNFPDVGASYTSDTSLIQDPNSGVFHFFDSGTITVSKVSYKSARGTFEFYNTKDGTKATGGSFSLTW